MYDEVREVSKEIPWYLCDKNILPNENIYLKTEINIEKYICSQIEGVIKNYNVDFNVLEYTLSDDNSITYDCDSNILEISEDIDSPNLNLAA